jgi:hypothetical protein
MNNESESERETYNPELDANKSNGMRHVPLLCRDGNDCSQVVVLSAIFHNYKELRRIAYEVLFSSSIFLLAHLSLNRPCFIAQLS